MSRGTENGERVADVAHGLQLLMRQYINATNPRRLFEDFKEQFRKRWSTGRFATSLLTSDFMATATRSVCNTAIQDIPVRSFAGWAVTLGN